MQQLCLTNIPDEVITYGILSFFTYKELVDLQLISKKHQLLIQNINHYDVDTIVKDVTLWRNIFKKSKTIKIKNATDKDFEHLKNMYAVYMNECLQITDVAFEALSGINNLSMQGCEQKTITDQAFTHLKGIKNLNMSWCKQITDQAFVNLIGINRLFTAFCTQLTDRAFTHLTDIKQLTIWGCPQLTDRALEKLTNLEILDISCCTLITDQVFKNLPKLKLLDMKRCHQLTDCTFTYLPNLTSVNVTDCPLITKKLINSLEATGVTVVYRLENGMLNSYEKLNYQKISLSKD